jgi:hypothetical protein
LKNGPQAVSRRDAIVYAAAVLVGAALVFQIQPIAGKLLLPVFGGGASIWTTCMFFFQSMLLAGYGYAHLMTTALRPRHQAVTHGALLLLSAAFLPVEFTAETLDSSASNPGSLIFLVLLLAIGFPFVMLASTAPLIQRWASMTRPTRTPYRLYALSNAGALLALLTYPLLVEPHVSLQAQTVAWSTGYGAFLLASLAACRMVWQRRDLMSVLVARGEVSVDGVGAKDAYGLTDGLLSVLLSACGVVLLLATTNQITQNVAPIPFLWILPLVAYLLTYILCFSGERWYDRAIWGSLFIVAASSLIILDFFGSSFAIVPVVVAYLLVLFCACMVCHGELYRLRPQPRQLTVYYLLIAIGGALGGAFVSVFAPYFFTRYWEGLAGTYLVYLVLGFNVLRESSARRKHNGARRASALQAQVEHWSRVLFGIGWSLGILLFPAVVISLDSLRVQYDVASLRNFYGVLNVRDVISDGIPRRMLVDGTTIHGFQLLEPSGKKTPTSYYSANTGIALVMENVAREGTGLSVGIVGLGAGTLAAYGQPLDMYRFYELNPAVIDVAQQHFSFLQDSAATIEIVPGDGRISLESELQQVGSRRYDVLIIDAFNSDAIPVHLLTLEAFQLYWSHLKPSGVLAFHVTNNYLDLAPVVANLAHHSGNEVFLVTTPIESGVTSTADWVLVGENVDIVAQNETTAVFTDRSSAPRPRLSRIWTDDYSDLMGALKQKRN